MPHDQADELRALAKRSARPAAAAAPPRFWAVSSGKGGVGTTTVAVNLAVSLGLAGHRVVLVDADLNRSDAAALCGLGPAPSIADLLAGRQSIHEILQRGPGGIQVVPGPWSQRELADPSGEAQQRLIAELETLGPHAEVVVLDVGSGLNRVVRRFWQRSELLVAVTSCEPVPLMDTYAALKVLLGEGSPQAVRAVVNLAPDEAAARSVEQRLVRACRRFLGLGIAAAPWIPRDAAVARAAETGAALCLAGSGSPAGQRLALLADELWAHSQRLAGVGPPPAHFAVAPLESPLVAGR